MKRTKQKNETPAQQFKNSAKKNSSGSKRKKAEMTPEQVAEVPKVSTGSTLLDLAITGSVSEAGGVPFGIMVEVFGPPGSGKTVLLCEAGGNVQRKGGNLKFRDPEGRLNKQWATQFDLDVDNMEYDKPNTVKEVFEPIREWSPEPEKANHAILTDSLAALSTEQELEQGDKRGQLRAKEFSEECRKTCRTLVNKGFLMLCTNQVRQNSEAGAFAQKYYSPGGEAIAFYSSLRLRTRTPKQIKKKVSYKGTEQHKTVGVETVVEVFKSSIAEPFKTAPLYIVYDYGIDDIRSNLQWLKTNTGRKSYQVNKESVGQGLDDAVSAVENDGLENDLCNEVIEVWHDIESKFKTERKKKKRV